MIAYKIQNLQIIKNPENVWLKKKQRTRMQNFKVISLFLTLQCQKKTGKGDDFFFLDAFFGIPIVVT